MRFVETPLQGAYIIELEPVQDERGFIARSWCTAEFRAYGLNTEWLQASVSYNRTRGTLRGLHYQDKPYEEVKLVRCTQGAIYDVIVDMRAGSDTFKHWSAVELTSENHKTLYVPKGFAHGFQTLEDHTEVLYQISEMYRPQDARGLRWDDPSLDITWPLRAGLIASRDESFAYLA